MPGIDTLAEFCLQHPRLLVLTGAGCSTASGIPAYRDDTGRWQHPRPVQFADFVGSAGVRRRYWARSAVGWSRIARARPSPAHEALAQLEADGRVAHLVTQNVDGLHQAAGSRRVTDLHGRLDQVRCLDCAQVQPRDRFQRALDRANHDWAPAARPAPDGDAQIADADTADFRVPPCARCGGVMKPDVVFFGETVPKKRVNDAMRALNAADALLVVGSSLMVYSGLRFAREAHRLGRPIAAVNRGQTRADELIRVKFPLDCNAALPALRRSLRATP
ncbi:MAG: NAD-dependent protein deacetylase [Chromatiales bacterium]|nr:MAG: NAD-dependent protein deacetylase [Chromatiales bacterium]